MLRFLKKMVKKQNTEKTPTIRPRRTIKLEVKIQLKLHHEGSVKYKEMPIYEYTAASAHVLRNLNVTAVVYLP